MLTRDQYYATTVYAQVESVAGASDAFRKKYGGLAHKLPVLIRTAGLAQALAFVAARGGEAGKCLLEHLAEALRFENQNKLLEEFRKDDLDLNKYIYLTQQALAALLWYKRFAQSVLDVDQTQEVELEVAA